MCESGRWPPEIDAMPTALRLGPYRFYFYSNDAEEPKHIHVERDGLVAKIWLEPVRIQRSGGFSRVEILRVLRLVRDHQRKLLEAWDEFFDG